LKNAYYLSTKGCAARIVLPPGSRFAAPNADFGFVKTIIASTWPEYFSPGDDPDYEIDTPLVPLPRLVG
jgi:hypothetical protein